jgi:MFS family permease
VYQIENQRQATEGSRWFRWGQTRPAVARNVLLLGMVSFLTDISSEMVATVLPLYLLFNLRLAPVQFGLIDGLYQGGSVLVRVASGFVADRWRRPKQVAALGYGLSAMTRIGLLLVRGPWLAILALIMVDRLGKGIRTAPRDALISLSTPAHALATAFGVHRSLDTAGAMLGPVLAFALLALAPESYDAIFVVSFCIAVVGVAVIVLFVRNPPQPAIAEGLPKVTLPEALALLRRPRLRMLFLVGFALSIATVSDSIIYLALQDQLQLNLGMFPLLFVATALVYMLLAVPVGRLADRLGRTRVFLAGYVVLGLAYLTLLVPGVLGPQLMITLLLLGTYYAMTDGVLQAIASSMIVPELRASGLGLMSTSTGFGRLLASLAFGLTWSLVGIQSAIAVFLVALIILLVVAAMTLGRASPEPANA